jgi:hypothetical protein
MIQHGVPTHIRSENGAEFTSKPIRESLQRVRAKTSASNRAVRGKTATAKASTASYAMNY